MEQWQTHVRRLKAELLALYLAYRDPRTPWGARLFVAGVVGYAFSPLDLIPDFIPVLGYIDDLLLLPLGIWLALRLIPAEVMADCRTQAAALLASDKPVNRTAAVVIVLIWLLIAILLFLWLRPLLIQL